MEITDFAAKHRLRTRELDGELVIICKGYKAGSRDYTHIYQYSAFLLGAIYLGKGRGWTYARKAAQKALCTVAQNGENEGTVLFNPEDREQVETVLEWWGAKRKKRVSPEQAEMLRERLARVRPGRG
jgi:hypothetical protein